MTSPFLQDLFGPSSSAAFVFRASPGPHATRGASTLDGLRSAGPGLDPAPASSPRALGGDGEDDVEDDEYFDDDEEDLDDDEEDDDDEDFLDDDEDDDEDDFLIDDDEEDDDLDDDEDDDEDYLDDDDDDDDDF